MKTAFYSLVLTVFVILPVRADLTIVYSTTVQPASHNQKVEPTPTAVAAGSNMTIKVKGDKARIDVSPQVTAIFDGQTGELINLLNDQKTIVRVAPDKMRAIADMLNKFNSNKAASDKPRLTPTGQREMINGYETEQYTYEGPDFKATYWIAPNYPNGAAVLAQLQSIKSELKENPAGEHAASGLGHPIEITSTVTGVSLDSVADGQFTVPANFKERKLPDIFNQNPAPSVAPNP